MELQSGNIDVIWNGMTINQEYYENMEISNAYMTNRQVAIIKKSNASLYTDIASMSDAKLGAEQQSAGEKAIRANGTLADNEMITLTAQTDVLNELKAGTIDVGFIDIVMATASVGEGTDYADLMIVENAMIGDDELYGIGMRKGSTELLEKINAAIKELYDDNTLTTIAAKYGLSSALVAQK